jgi:DNA-binding LacI/PurR family transcriptional regulator
MELIIMSFKLPKYILLKEKIKRKIISGELSEGALLPSQREMMDSENISYSTVTRVFSELTHDGLIFRIQGKGTFVADGVNIKINAQEKLNSEITENTTIYIVTNRPFLQSVPKEAELFSNYYNVTEMTRGILEAAIKHGVKIENLYFTDEEFNCPDLLLKRFTKKSNIGFFFFHYSGVEPLILILKKHKIPYLVQTAMNGVEKDINCIATNVKEPYRHLTRALIENGHRQIVFVNALSEEEPWAEPKFEGYKQALAEKGIMFDENLIIRTESPPEIVSEKILALLKKRDKNLPTAFVAVNDLRALGAMDALKKYGLKIPEDAVVTGFDNIPQAAMAKPPLTTLRRQCCEIGFESVRLLMKFIEEPDLQPLVKIMTSKLIVRESCPIEPPPELLQT